MPGSPTCATAASPSRSRCRWRAASSRRATWRRSPRRSIAPTRASTISAIASRPCRSSTCASSSRAPRPKPYLRPLARAASEAPVAEQTLKVFFDGDWHDVPLLPPRGAGSASPLLRPLRHRAGRHDGLRAARLRRHGRRQRQHRSRAGGVTAMKVDKVTLQILANHCAPRPRAWPTRCTARRIRPSSRRPRTSPSRSSMPAGRTVAVPMDLGATWYPGLDYGRAIPMISSLRAGRHRAHQRSLFRLSRHAYARSRAVEADLP